MSGEQKLDSGLSAAYRAWTENPDTAPDAGISVNLTVQGDLAEIEALGFETHSAFGEQVIGVIRFKDIPAISAHPAVVRIAAGRRRKRDLDTAVRDIRARASMPISGGNAVDGIWHADVDDPVLTSIPKATGKGVIVAIMDTGIDYMHPMFISQLSPAMKTRILRIWDQGLTPASVSECPKQKYLASAETYGVEYNSAAIEAELNGGTSLRHRDCDGHGTHVAGIAAGGTTFTPFVSDASRVGVAPEADIIVVKYLDTPDHLFYRKQDDTVGDEVSPLVTFRDGVLYCLRNAREMNKPVVINMSFGDDSMPGDALDDDARWLDDVLNPNKPEGINNFPKRAVVTKSAGNEAGSFRAIRIEVPSSGTIIVPLKLIDARGTAQTTWQRCTQEYYNPEMSVHFWYRETPFPLGVQFAVQLPHGAAFGADVSAGSKLEVGFEPVAGPTPVDKGMAFLPNKHRYTIDHENIAAVPHPKGGTVKRNHVHFFVNPKETGGMISYHQGVYKVRITAPPNTVIFAQGDVKYWAGDKPVVFRMDDPPLPPNITVPDESTTLDPMGENVITVANYDDKDGDTTDSDFHRIASSSSRGPLRDYSNPSRQPFCMKPDIAAPGEGIDSAESLHTDGFGIVRALWWYLGDRFQELSGTSMAAPMVAGVIATIFEKKPNLSTTQVRTALFSAPRAAVSPSTPPDSKNAYGAGMVDAVTSHKNA